MVRTADPTWQMRIFRDNEAMILKPGVENVNKELHLSVVGTLFFAITVIGVFLKATSLLSAIFVLLILSPFLAFALVLAVPNKYGARSIVIDRRRNEISQKKGWYKKHRSRIRDLREISAVLIIEDRLRYGLEGIGKRYTLFFCLCTKANKRNVLYIGEVDTAKDAANDSRKVSEYLSQPIEYLTLDRELTDEDVNCEDW